MNRLLLKKAIHESRWLWLACAAALFAFCWIRVWIVSQFEMSRFQTIVEQFREYERFSPVPFEQLFTYAGRIAVTYDEPIVILCVSVWAIARGSDCISGELNRGTMEMLLAQPVRRCEVVLSQAAVTIVGVALLSLVTWLGIYVGVQTNSVVEEPPRPVLRLPLLGITIPNPLAAQAEPQVVPLRERVDSAVFIPATFNMFCLGFFLAALSTFLSSWDRYRWRTIGLAVGIYVVATAMKVISMASDRWEWLRYGTFFTVYEPEHVTMVALNQPEVVWNVLLRDAEGRITALGPLGYNLVLLGLGAVAYALALLIFQRRDLPAPL